MKLEEVNKKYNGEWIVARVLKMMNGQPEELDVLFHSKKRDEAYKKADVKGLIALFYAGEIEDVYAITPFFE